MGQAHHNIRSILQKAMNLHQQGDIAQAEQMYRQVLEAEPQEPNALHLLGVVYWNRDDLPLAEEYIRNAIQVNSTVATFHANLAGVLRQKGDVNGAIKHYETALKLAPQDAISKKELAYTLHQHGMRLANDRLWKAAETAYKRALELDPENISTLNNLASLTQNCGDRAGARTLYDRALQLQPVNLALRYNRATCCLTQGDLAAGWEDFTASQSYWQDKQDERYDILPWKNVPLWDGKQSLEGKKIIIWGDQGIGDEIIYISCIPDLLERGANVTVECNERLVPLIQRSFPSIKAVARQNPPAPSGDFDFQAPGMWLARCVRPDLTSFPSRQSFLQADPAIVDKLRRKYQALGKKKIIGISWHTQTYSWGAERSVPLSSILDALPLKDLVLVDLQYGDTASAWDEAKKKYPALTVIRDAEIDQLKNMDDYAAQVAACDGAITICNTTSHVAGALGVPAAVFMANEGLTWYWFEKGEQCSWYPSLKLLRPSVQDRFVVAAKLTGDL